MKTLKKIKLLGVGFTDATAGSPRVYITGLRKSTEKYYIVTPNPELLVIADNDNHYKNILNGAKLALPDGIGVMIAAKLLSSH